MRIGGIRIGTEESAMLAIGDHKPATEGGTVMMATWARLIGTCPAKSTGKLRMAVVQVGAGIVLSQFVLSISLVERLLLPP